MSWLAYAPGPQRGEWQHLHDLPTTLSSAQSGFQAPALDVHAGPESLPALPASPDMVPSWSRASDFAHRVDEQAARHGTTDVAIGWPAFSFSTCIAKRIRGHPTRGTVVLMIEDGYSPFKRDPNLATQRLLAWRPIFPGLILSSLFWSSSLWLLAALCSFSRATLRHRKHLCTLCSYDTRGFAFCPECATPRANAPSLLSHLLARDAIRLPSVNQKIHVRLTPS